MFGTKAKVLFFDTETSGFISKKLSADDPNQAWTVQIGAILANKDEVFEELNIIIKADGREMNYHAEKIHGISVEKADKEGVPELEAIERFGAIMRKAELLVCHNFDFDWAYVQHMMERNMDNLSDEARSAFYFDLPSFCTMKDKAVKQYVQARNKAGHIKFPKLIELYEKLFGTGFDNAHDAFADITATKDCFYELLEREIIKIN